MSLKNFFGLGYYVSPLDTFLNEFDQTHPKLSRSQQQEVNKYKRIYALRDHAHTQTEADSFWEAF